ncbi:hypothetical protein DS031_18650 [Bacillus taeanensis]|uniref:Uncharacterized protein n=1 Tax=Bacillus taeanensis TaxID=273032 RepID=A0A366XQU5_9BACI|nr:hypothetical protein DS031_18650 [Bacillus taeanensis]
MLFIIQYVKLNKTIRFKMLNLKLYFGILKSQILGLISVWLLFDGIDEFSKVELLLNSSATYYKSSANVVPLIIGSDQDWTLLI